MRSLATTPTLVVGFRLSNPGMLESLARTNVSTVVQHARAMMALAQGPAIADIG
ncbi:MAG: hypothetical protein EPN41_12670 [Candidimonas sp.]|nr:MAG: hypothetical protein EPN41_12670 [Candidimonas sp.]